MVVTCEKQDPEALAISAPVLILEVLSRTTRDKNQTVKLTGYREIPSLMHYAIVDQTRRMVQLTSREADGSWSWVVLEEEGVLAFPALGVTLDLAELYFGVFDEV